MYTIDYGNVHMLVYVHTCNRSCFDKQCYWRTDAFSQNSSHCHLIDMVRRQLRHSDVKDGAVHFIYHTVTLCVRHVDEVADAAPFL